MKHNLLLLVGLCSLVWVNAGIAQSAPAQTATQGQAAASAQPVSYASMTALNDVLAKLEAASKSTQADLVKVRIERWKADNATKKEALGNVDSIQRNLSGALPTIMGQLRSAPEDVPTTFKLYRNLDALYDVLGSVVEATGAFGSKDDLQALVNDLNTFEAARRQLGERIENLAAAKEVELVRLRTDLKAAQAAIPAAPPKKIVVDDNEPVKKPVVKKKATPKPATPPTTTPAKPPAGQTTAPQTNPQ